MSIAASALGEMPLCADFAPMISTSKTPKNRRVAAKADAVQRPEPR